MSLYTEIDFNIQTFDTSAKENCSFISQVSSHTLDVFTQESSGRVTLQASASDIAFSFQQLTTAQLVILKSDSEFTVKLNGVGNQAITVKPQTNTSTGVSTPAFLMLLGDSITSLHFGNPNAASAVVEVAVAGV